MSRKKTTNKIVAKNKRDHTAPVEFFPTRRASKSRTKKSAAIDRGRPNAAPGKENPSKTRTRISGLDAAAKVLAEVGKPMTTHQMVEIMTSKGLWTTGGRTPAASIYSAIFREIKTKGRESRFWKSSPGKFIVARRAK